MCISLHRLILRLQDDGENEWAELRACVLIAIGDAFVGARNASHYNGAQERRKVFIRFSPIIDFQFLRTTK
jgi:hypothetical protein